MKIILEQAKLGAEEALDRWLFSLEGGVLGEKKNNIRTGQAWGGGGFGRMMLFVGRRFLSNKRK